MAGESFDSIGRIFEQINSILDVVTDRKELANGHITDFQHIGLVSCQSGRTSTKI
jgi:hypothetical protein